MYIIWDPELGIDDTTFFWNAVIRFKVSLKGGGLSS
jgi:hypothetical protein